MPRKSLPKRKPRKSSVEKTPERSETPDKLSCTACPKSIPFDSRKKEFPTVRSPLYAYNEYLLPICWTCFFKIFDNYCKTFNDEKTALRRICMKFDIYYSEDCYRMAVNSVNAVKDGNTSLLKQYLGKLGLRAFFGKTYDTTIEEEHNQLINGDYEFTFVDSDGNVKNPKKLWDEYLVTIENDKKKREQDEINDIPLEQREQFGLGFEKDEYIYMAQLYVNRLEGIPEGCYSSLLESVKDECRFKVMQNRYLIKNDTDSVKKYTEMYLNTKKYIDTVVKDYMKSTPEEEFIIGVSARDVENFCCADVYKKPTAFADVDGIKDYVERFLVRPFKNFFTGSREMDKEYSIGDDEEK